MKRELISALLSMVMVVSFMPTAASAYEGQEALQEGSQARLETEQPQSNNSFAESLYAAKVGDKSYTTIEDAIAAANGATVKLLKDLTIDRSVKVDRTVVIDGAGHTITLNYTGAPGTGNAIFNDYSENEGIVNSLTVKDLKMEITGTTKNGYAFVAGKGTSDFDVSFTDCSFKNMYCGAKLNGRRGTQAPEVTISDCKFDNVSYGVSFEEVSYAGNVIFSDNYMKGEIGVQEIFTNQQYITEPTVKITDGFYSADPSDYCAAGKAATASGNSEYPFTVEDIVANVEVAPADPDVAVDTTGKTTMQANAMANAKNNMNSVSADGLAATAGDAAASITSDDIALASARLAQEGVNISNRTVTVYVQPYLDIKIEDAQIDSAAANKIVELTVDITPMIKRIASIATSADQIVTDGVGKNAVQLGSSEKAVANVPITFTVPLPNNFVSSVNEPLYVKHTKENGSSYVYVAALENKAGTYYATFTNPNGFSDFVFSTANPAVAQIGNQNYYATLQAAVDAVQNNDVIVLLKDAGTATVDRTVSFSVVKSIGVTFDKDDISAGQNTKVTISGTADSYTYSFVYKAPRSRGGGGTSAAKGTYAISLPSNIENGSITLSKTAASAGDKVILTIEPNSGFTLEILKATDAKGNEIKLTAVEIGKEYTFTMPASDVSFEVTFMDDNTMLNFFVDVTAADYYYDAVLWAATNGITTGTDGTHFSPNADCTRGQIVTFLWRAAGSPEPKALSAFSDVAADSYCAKAVAWAVESGITKGTSDTEFSPNAICNRAQCVTFLARALNGKANAAAAFSDVSADSYYADAVAWAAENKITTGVSETLFAPDDNCTRGQIVTFLLRAKSK